MGICSFLVLGAIAGWLASVLLGTQKMGIIANIGLGVIGSVVGGVLFSILGGSGVTGFNPYSLMVATAGAALVLTIAGKLRGK